MRKNLQNVKEECTYVIFMPGAFVLVFLSRCWTDSLEGEVFCLCLLQFLPSFYPFLKLFHAALGAMGCSVRGRWC